jgi:hypothetical protein
VRRPCSTSIGRRDLLIRASTSITGAPCVAVPDENPLSQGGKWITGLSAGFWKAPAVINGVACASVPNDSDADDSIAVPNPALFSFGSDYYIEATVRRAANYVNTSGHEIELHMQRLINPGNPGTSPGIECTWQFLDTPSSQSQQLVIWPGAPNQFDTSTLGGVTVTGGFEILDGDVLAFRKSGNNYFIYHNDVQICTFTNNTFSSGGPGIGHFMRSGGDAQSYGWRRVAITAGVNTAFIASQVYTANTRSFPITNLDPNLSSFKCMLSRESWPVGNNIVSVNVEAALDGVHFQNVGGGTFSGGNLTFKGRPVTHNRVICGLPGQGTSGRAARITFQNSVSVRTAVSGLMF